MNDWNDEWRSAINSMSELDRVYSDRAYQDSLGVYGDREDARDE